MDYEKRLTINFLGTIIEIPEDARTGKCSLCGKSYPEDLIRQPSIHHIEYDPENPLANTVELCNSCHAKQHDHRETTPTPKLEGHRYNQEAFIQKIHTLLK